MHMHGVSALACVHISPQREREGLGAVCQSIEGERERVRERERERERERVPQEHVRTEATP